MKNFSRFSVVRQMLPAMLGCALVLLFCAGGRAQAASLYPSYNIKPLPADISGMSDDAARVAARMRLGWNVGNTMEAVGGETGWGNPLVSNTLIQLVKKNGFNAIRLPVAWNQHADQKTGKISDTWLARVRQVVQYCVDNDMYVLVNIHWDGGWLQENLTADKQAAVNARQKVYWEQIATLLRDYDSHVLFASANEPDVKNATQMAILTSYHQTFVDAVRSTGGRNAYRVLVVQGPSTDMTGDNLRQHLSARAYYHKYIVSAALRNGMIPFYWDTGGVGPNSFGLFDRKNNTVADQQTINAMREGANGL